MKRHACDNHEQKYTHSFMAGGRDHWSRRVGRFSSGDSPRSQEWLAKALAHFYQAEPQHKVFLTEHPSDLYAFVEDIDIEGSKTSGVPDVMSPDQ